MGMLEHVGRSCLAINHMPGLPRRHGISFVARMVEEKSTAVFHLTPGLFYNGKSQIESLAKSWTRARQTVPRSRAELQSIPPYSHESSGKMFTIQPVTDIVG